MEVIPSGDGANDCPRASAIGDKGIDPALLKEAPSIAMKSGVGFIDR